MLKIKTQYILLVASSLFLLAACNSDIEPKAPRVTLSQGKRALASGNFERAAEIASQLLEQKSDSVPSLMLAAEAATKLEDYERAIELYDKIPDTKTSDAAIARWAIGEIYFHVGEASKSLAYLEQSLALNPNLAYAHIRLSTSLDNLGFRWASREHLLALLKSGEVSFPNLVFLGNIRKETYASDEVERYLKANPDDLLPNVAKASHLRSQGQLSEAKELIVGLLKQNPKVIEAHIQLGRILLEEGAFDSKDEFQAWNESLPAEADSHPDTWYLRARSQQFDNRLAAELYSRAIEIDPNHLPALQGLTQVAAQSSLTDIANLSAERAKLVQSLNLKLQQLYQDRDNLEHVEDAAQLTFQLGRYWEAFAWCMIGRDLATSNNSSPPKWINQMIPLISAERLDATTPQTIVTKVPLLAALSKRPTANMIADSAPESEQRPLPKQHTLPNATDASNARLVNVAADLGVNFTYSNGQSSRELGRLMQQFTGGGVGTADFNRDGWCDLYLVQGESIKPNETISDQIFFNVDGKRFKNSTLDSRIDAHLFGQGIAIGDVNGDGFDDIFLGTIAENQLWLNQGDGTFLSANFLLHQTDQQETAWTTSALIGDINGDGLADIYEANYVTGDGIFTQRCQVEGKSSVCSPLAFEPAADRVFFASDSGKFVQAEESIDLIGNSLGACLFRMDSAQLPHVFVAVDQQANLLLTSPERGSKSPPENEALLRGVAYDEDGNAQACMGIAMADADGDGQVDIHVTNFHEEYNTLYIQKNGIFIDRTAAKGLVSETLPMLGFGVQAFDAQRDGLMDFLVLNGHIDDQTHTGAPEKMPAQLFMQTQAGFQSTSSAGEFFNTAGLGRSLAKWDFDRDGRDDFVATDLEAPISILRNESISQNSLVRVRLVGTESERAALTAIATLSGIVPEAKPLKISKQLVGGGGYLASNELYVDFAVPAGTTEISIFVDWPAGTKETFDGISVDHEYLLVEGGDLHELQSFDSE